MPPILGREVCLGCLRDVYRPGGCIHWDKPSCVKMMLPEDAAKPVTDSYKRIAELETQVILLERQCASYLQQRNDGRINNLLLHLTLAEIISYFNEKPRLGEKGRRAKFYAEFAVSRS